MKAIQVGLLGIGTVGSGTYKVLTRNQEEIRRRAGRAIEITMVADLDIERARGIVGDGIQVVADGREVIANPDIDIVVELIGGYGVAKALVLEAIAAGKHVVTANKALLAVHGNEIFAAAREKGVMVAFEAAVAGGIPIIKALREGLTANRIEWIAGIINGTTNFILSAMDSSGAGYAETLEEASRLGYAEADPTADVDGYDAASKAAILASLAFHTRVTSADVYREGIAEVSAADILAARQLGRTVKLLAICERVVDTAGTEWVSARVYPAMIPRSHPLATVAGAYNAVFVEADAAGALMFYGQGAGGAPTASAVLGDLVAVARNRVAGGYGPRESAYADLPIRPMGDTPTSYHLSLEVVDRPGVLAQVAQVFAEHEVSIMAVRQTGHTPDRALPDNVGAGGAGANLVIVTHSAPDAALRSTVDKLAGLGAVRDVISVMRVEGEVR